MKTIISFFLLLCWASAVAQTNTTPAAAESLALPRTELTSTMEPEKPAESIATNNRVRLKLELPLPKQESTLLDDFSVPIFEDVNAPTTLNSEQALMQRYHERLKNAGYMNPTPAPPDDLFSRTVNAMFQPEPVRFGRTTVAFSPITSDQAKEPVGSAQSHRFEYLLVNEPAPHALAGLSHPARSRTQQPAGAEHHSCRHSAATAAAGLRRHCRLAGRAAKRSENFLTLRIISAQRSTGKP